MIEAVELEIFKGLLTAIPEEMGVTLRRSSFSANIKERLDFSCALFDPQTAMIAQAAHIPVHLGAMPLSVQACVAELPLGPGDTAILNDPYRGGTHLPDLTLVSPIYWGSPPQLVGYAANRAHHADIGGISPGSMPLSTDISQEGLLIQPTLLVVNGQLQAQAWEAILAAVRTPDERAGDLRAQLAANRVGVERMQALIERYAVERVARASRSLLQYSEAVTRSLLAELPDGSYRAEQFLDNDGAGDKPVRIAALVTIAGDQATIDFSGSDRQRPGNVNATRAITLSAVYYVFRSLLALDVPSNSGCLAPIEVICPPGSVVNAGPPAAVAAGNVETSQRIVDCVLLALAQLLPDRIPAASQGTMNNLTVGGWDPIRQQPYAYYETIGGGMGARPTKPGASAIHTHMTNTLNTPVEALEFAFPLRVRRYAIREGSGGAGRHCGGDGVVRELELLAPAEVTILSDRRRFPPYGLQGGRPGAPGRNLLIRDGEERKLPGKVHLKAEAGDRIRIETPGGGGFGEPAKIPGREQDRSAARQRSPPGGAGERSEGLG